MFRTVEIFSEFEKVASLYDVILYEFGNSEFHSHMLPLLKKFPGVVGLHDGYLSGLFHYNHLFHSAIIASCNCVNVHSACNRFTMHICTVPCGMMISSRA